jgi:hypothetical protein
MDPNDSNLKFTTLRFLRKQATQMRRSSAPKKKTVFSLFFVFLHLPNNRLENISVSLFAPIQIRSQKYLFFGRKIL